MNLLIILILIAISIFLAYISPENSKIFGVNAKDIFPEDDLNDHDTN
ncbi:hypothetical protein [uncultured Kordia sp.]|nr:hypothetical protein [uncultured Kordia sp.]